MKTGLEPPPEYSSFSSLPSTPPRPSGNPSAIAAGSQHSQVLQPGSGVSQPAAGMAGSGQIKSLRKLTTAKDGFASAEQILPQQPAQGCSTSPGLPHQPRVFPPSQGCSSSPGLFQQLRVTPQVQGYSSSPRLFQQPRVIPGAQGYSRSPGRLPQPRVAPPATGAAAGDASPAGPCPGIQAGPAQAGSWNNPGMLQGMLRWPLSRGKLKQEE